MSVVPRRALVEWPPQGCDVLLTATLKRTFSVRAYQTDMSFPVARLNRRILSRQRCARPCVIHFGPERSTRGSLREIDAHGARLRLDEPCPEVGGDLLIILDDGAEVYAAAAWRIGDVIGVRRHPANVARARALGRE